MINGDHILQAIRRADQEKHGAQQAWIDEDRGIDDVCLDGYFNLERIAELLNEDIVVLEDIDR